LQKPSKKSEKNPLDFSAAIAGEKKRGERKKKGRGCCEEEGHEEGKKEGRSFLTR